MPREVEQVLSIRSLDVFYGGVQAARDISFDVAKGEIVGLVGESGSGKSSVLRAVAGLLGRSGTFTATSLSFSGVELSSLNRSKRAAFRGLGMAYVFQDPVLSLDPLFRVGTQFDECLRAHGVASGDAMRSLERELLHDMGFENPDRVLASYPHNLSGGMCQRVVLAFSVACRPQLLLADEPTSALDVVAQEQVVRLLRGIRDDYRMAMLVVSHNMGLIAQMSNRIGVMYRGRLVEFGERNQVLHTPSHPYTRDLIAAVPPADGSLPRLSGSLKK